MHISFMLKSDGGSLTGARSLTLMMMILSCAETGEMIHLPIKLDYCGRYNGVLVSACLSVSLTVSIWFLCVGLCTSGCDCESLSLHDPSWATRLIRQTQDLGCSMTCPTARIPCIPSMGILSSVSWNGSIQKVPSFRLIQPNANGPKRMARMVCSCEPVG
jgi:hypothetical protein